MEITVEQIGVVRVVSPHGRLDLVASTEFENALNELINSGATLLLIDGHQLRYVSSSGLGAFVNAAKQLGDRGTVAFSNLNHHVQHVFEMVGFLNFFQVYGSRQEAVEAMVQQGE
jgi:anti-sigma B factor antagonist